MLRVVGTRPLPTFLGELPERDRSAPARACIRGLIGKQGADLGAVDTRRTDGPPVHGIAEGNLCHTDDRDAARSGARARGKAGLTVDGLRATGRCDCRGSGVSWFQRAGEPRAHPAAARTTKTSRGSRWSLHHTNSGYVGETASSKLCTRRMERYVDPRLLHGWLERGPIGCPVAPSRYEYGDCSTQSNNRRHQ